MDSLTFTSTILIYGFLFLISLAVSLAVKIKNQQFTGSISWRKGDYLLQLLILFTAIFSANFLNLVIPAGSLKLFYQIVLVTVVSMTVLFGGTIFYLKNKITGEGLERYLAVNFQIKSFPGGIIDYIRYVFPVGVVVGVNYYLLNYFEFSRVKPVSQQILLLADTDFKLIILFVLVVLLAPLVEELFFRGCFYRLLRSSFSPFQSALLSSIAFAAVHLEPYYFPSLFFIGYLLARVYEKRGNLGEPVAFHSFHNFVAMVLYYAVS